MIFFILIMLFPRSLSFCRTGGNFRHFSKATSLLSGFDEVAGSSNEVVGSKPESNEIAGIFNDQRVLVVGDGSLAFSAALSRSRMCASVTASTWDSPESLQASYADAGANVELISRDNSVVYGVDATKLNSTLGTFDLVVWNFPHVPGKANNKRNRALIDGFLNASKNVLENEKGAVLISLCPEQSGWHATTHREYLQSWKLPHYAAERGYLCSKMLPFESILSFCGELYYPVGHRGSGGRFSAYQGKADVFILSPNGSDVNALQAPLYSHEIHINAPAITDIGWLETEMMRAVRAICDEHEHSEINDGVVWSCQVVDVYVCPRTKLICQAVELSYCSTATALGRELADSIRVRVEEEIIDRLNTARGGKSEDTDATYFSLRREKVGGRVSQPHFWQVALRKRALESGRHTRHTNLNNALRTVEKAGLAKETLGLLSEDNLGKTRSSGGGDPDVETIRELARLLWQRRLGVLIREVGVEAGAGDDKEHGDDEGHESGDEGGLWSLYLLHHKTNGRTYIGVTTDLERRLLQHNGVISGGAKYTRAFRDAGGGSAEPWRVVVSIPHLTRGRALSLEARAKTQSKSLGPSSSCRAVRRAKLLLDLAHPEEREGATVASDLGLN